MEIRFPGKSKAGTDAQRPFPRLDFSMKDLPTGVCYFREDGSLAFFSSGRRNADGSCYQTLYRDLEETDPFVSLIPEKSGLVDFISVDIVDPFTNQCLAIIKGGGIKAFFFTESATILDPDGKPIATIRDDSLPESSIRVLMRILLFFSWMDIPRNPERTFGLYIGSKKIASYECSDKPEIGRLKINLATSEVNVDERIGMALAMMVGKY